MEELIKQLKERIIDELSLDDLTPDDLDQSEALFQEGLELDSIDALSIAVVFERDYGIKIEEQEQREAVFYSIETMAKHIMENRK